MVTQWKPALQSIPFRDKVLFGIHANGAEYRRLLTQQQQKKRTVYSSMGTRKIYSEGLKINRLGDHRIKLSVIKTRIFNSETSPRTFETLEN